MGLAEEDIELIVGTYEDYLVGYHVETIPSRVVDMDSEGRKINISNVSRKTKSKTNSIHTCLEQSFAIRAHSGSVRSLACNADGTLTFSAGYDEMMNLLSLKRRKLLHTLEGAMNCSLFVENSHLICGCEDSNIYIYECKGSNMTLLKTLRGHKQSVISMDAHPSGKILLSLSSDNTLRTWNLIKGRCAYVTSLNHLPGHLVKWSKSGKNFVLAANKEIYLYNSLGSLEHKIELEKRINSLEFLSDKIFVVAIDSGKLEFFRLTKSGGFETTLHFAAHEARIKSVKCLTIKDTPNKTELSDKDSETASINRSNRIATASSDGLVKFWSVSIDDENRVGLPQELAQVDLGARLTCMIATARKRN